MIQAIGNNFRLINGTNTGIVLSNDATALRSITFGGTSNGTVTFYNSATAAGTAATNEIMTIGSLVATNFPYSLEPNVPCSNGLVYTATGSPVMTVTFD